MANNPESPIITQEKNDLSKYEFALRKFLRTHFQEENIKSLGYSHSDFDISAPRSEDIQAVRSGKFQITNFSTTPSSSPDKINFHFYIGNTEFHITGKAAEIVMNNS